MPPDQQQSIPPSNVPPSVQQPVGMPPGAAPQPIQQPLPPQPMQIVVAPPHKKKKLWLIIVVTIVFLLSVGGVAAWYLLSNRIVVYEALQQVQSSKDELRLDPTYAMQHPVEMQQTRVDINGFTLEHTKGDRIVSRIDTFRQFYGAASIPEIEQEFSEQLRAGEGEIVDKIKQNVSFPENLKFEPAQEYTANDAMKGYRSEMRHFRGSDDKAHIVQAMVVFDRLFMYIVLLETQEDVWQANTELLELVLSSLTLQED
jgi:hypothetical protein